MWAGGARPAHKSGGRGLEIMRSLVDDVNIDSDQHGTVVIITKRLSSQA
jgi:anti-sigma regulatory factor (Ser/Thr protein kinase)